MNQKGIVFWFQFLISRTGRRNCSSQFLNLRNCSTSSQNIVVCLYRVSNQTLLRCVLFRPFRHPWLKNPVSILASVLPFALAVIPYTTFANVLPSVLAYDIPFGLWHTQNLANTLVIGYSDYHPMTNIWYNDYPDSKCCACPACSFYCLMTTIA